CITVYTSPEGSGLGRFSIRLGYETSLVARKHREVLGVPRQGIELLGRARQAFVILRHSSFSSLSSNCSLRPPGDGIRARRTTADSISPNSRFSGCEVAS